MWVGCAVVGVVRGAPSCGVGGVCGGGSGGRSHLCGVGGVCSGVWGVCGGVGICPTCCVVCVVLPLARCASFSSKHCVGACTTHRASQPPVVRW